MNNRIPDNEKKLKISISIDPELNKKVEKIIEKRFYKKSRFFEFLIKKYIEDNDSES
jgi:metal-responsive CopG/Arc/MetJ family transcriptional regulator